MDKNAIKKYAVWARRELISRISGRAAWYGITEDICVDADADSIDGRVLSATEKKQRAAFISKVQHEGYEQAIEEVAYTWFNRFCGLRYMEVNGYLPSHIRVFTDDINEFKPQILDEAIHLEIEGLDKEKVLTYKDTNDTEGLYRYLLITQCNALNSILPGMFQRIEDYTELLLPENLLRDGSVIERMIAEIPEEDWTDQVQIIGWLYQYYNAEKKDEVFAALKKNVKITKENIPAATQLFTPDWIVRYMVENSLGRLWVEGHPNDDLKSGWKYYIDEAEQEPQVEEQLGEIRKEYATLKPEDIKCIDPCCGSGHILVYMFDVLMHIYKSYGYTAQESAGSIVSNNLFGLDIDERAAQLAYFAVMMKARSYDNFFWVQEVQPHVYAIQESNDLDDDLINYFVGKDQKLKQEFELLIEDMQDAKEYGSILNSTLMNFDALDARVEEVRHDISFYTLAVEDQIIPLIQQAKVLAQKYHVIVTNPPYMSSGGMNKQLVKYLKIYYAESRSDMFAVFIEKSIKMSLENGFISMITQPSWMFLSSFENMQKKIVNNMAIQSLLHMGRGIFGIDFGSVAFNMQNTFISNFIGSFYRLHKQNFQYIDSIDIQNIFLSALNDKEFEYDFTLYKNDESDCTRLLNSQHTPNAQKVYYCTKQNNFSLIKGYPIAYWCPEVLFKSFSLTLVGDKFNVKSGLSTGDNDVFVKNWYEISAKDFKIFNSKGKWVPYNKGGGFRKWFGVITTVVNWGGNGENIRNYGKAVFRNSSYYFKDGITWTGITSSIGTFRYCPTGYIFDSNKGPMIFEKSEDLFVLLGYLNTNVANMIIQMLNPTVSIQIGDIVSIPYISLTDEEKSNVRNLVIQNIKLSKEDWDAKEISWDFKKQKLICPNAKSIIEAWEQASFKMLDCCEKLRNNEECLNEIYIDKYGLSGYLSKEVTDDEITVDFPNKREMIISFISYAVGCMFGRYSLDVNGLVYAGGDWKASNYQTYKPDSNGILPICDDEYFTDDIVGHFIDFVRTVYGEDTLEENLQFIANALGGNGTSREIIRKYFLNDFFADHCKIYQKRPIYWLFDSGKKNGFKCLIYLHRYQPDTIARIRTDYVHEQQARYRTAIADLENRIETASTSDRIKLNKELKKVQEQADELHDYEEKIHHLADQYIDIDLDDGVKVNYAKFQDVLAKIK